MVHTAANVTATATAVNTSISGGKIPVVLVPRMQGEQRLLSRIAVAIIIVVVVVDGVVVVVVVVITIAVAVAVVVVVVVVVVGDVVPLSFTGRYAFFTARFSNELQHGFIGSDAAVYQ